MLKYFLLVSFDLASFDLVGKQDVQSDSEKEAEHVNVK